MRALPRGFYDRDTRVVARALLGCVLAHDHTAGRIIETEAYLADDPASHSHNGKTARNSSMFGPPGHAYVYFTYGMHHCVNVVTRREGTGEAVLIRALEPLDGIELMKRRRKGADHLCSGPAKLTQALAITRAHDGADLTRGALRILPPESYPGWSGKEKILTTPRIGITKAIEKKWRCVVQG